MSNTLQHLEQRIGIQFANKDLLRQAVTHRSYCNENAEAEHNERLEFLGDAVLQMVVIEYLYDSFPDIREGVLSKYAAALVREETLARVADTLGLQECVLRSRGCDISRSILGDTVEAIIGALYKDGGFEVAQQCIEKHIFPYLQEIIDSQSWYDSKSRLNEVAQSRGFPIPRYETECEDADAPEKVFHSTVFVEGGITGTGSGSNKQSAEQKAAKDVLTHLQG